MSMSIYKCPCQVDDMSYLDELLRDIAGWGSEDPRFLSIVDNNR